MSECRLSQSEIDIVKRAAALLASIDRPTDAQMALIIADGLRTTAKNLVIVADSLDPRGASLILHQVPVGQVNIGINNLLATIRSLQKQLVDRPPTSEPRPLEAIGIEITGDAN
jgi:hypothetical protein